jgi:hypothetical protein
MEVALTKYLKKGAEVLGTDKIHINLHYVTIPIEEHPALLSSEAKVDFKLSTAYEFLYDELSAEFEEAAESFGLECVGSGDIDRGYLPSGLGFVDFVCGELDVKNLPNIPSYFRLTSAYSQALDLFIAYDAGHEVDDLLKLDFLEKTAVVLHDGNAEPRADWQETPLGQKWIEASAKWDFQPEVKVKANGLEDILNKIKKARINPDKDRSV